MLIKYNNLILEETNRPYLSNSTDYIVYDIMSYSSISVINTYVFLKSERIYLKLSEFEEFIDEKRLIRWRSEKLKVEMLDYYKNLLCLLKKHTREEKVNKIINPSLYNLDNLCLAC